MSVVTDTTNHENEVGVVVLGWQTTRAWIPAYAGVTFGEAGPGYSYNRVLSIPVSAAGQRRRSAVERIHTGLAYMESHSSGRTGV